MECAVVHQQFERGKRLLIADIHSLSCLLLDVLNYFDSLPESWSIRYFHGAKELLPAMGRGDIQSDSVVVLPSDEDLVPDRTYALAVRCGIKLLVLIGAKRTHFIDNRYRQYYL